MKILITGAKGQIGSELRNILEEKLPGKAVYTDVDDLDLTDTDYTRRYMEEGMFTHVVNCAAYNAIDRAEEECARANAINSDAVSNLAKYADEYGYKIIHISTDYVYDGITFRPYNESDKVNPTSQYGSTKRKGETSLLAMAPDSVIIRTGWLFSPHGNNFVKKILSMSQDRDEIEVVSDRIGTPTYARDLASAIVSILMSRQWVPGVFNFSNEGVASWYDFAKSVLKIAGINKCKISPISAVEYHTMANRPYYSVLDKTRIKATYGLSIPYWQDSLEHCIKRIKKSTNK